MTDVATKAMRLIRGALSDAWWDGDTVSDILKGYAEPGYGDDDACVILGDWNVKRYPRDGDAPLTKTEALPRRLGDALERIGAHCEWSDEWAKCEDCGRAMRTQSDSYGWQMFGHWDEEACGYVCADCLRKDVPRALETYVNDSDKCVTFLTAAELETAGWTQYAAHNPHRYQNGWFDGMNDKPADVFATIRRETEADVVFLLTEASQFYISFAAFTKDVTDEDETEEEE